jgi:ribosome-binding protein aMBF1 (putative translation factor)
VASASALRSTLSDFPDEWSPYLSPLMAKGGLNIVKNNLGRNVKELRLSTNISQIDLADKAKVCQPLISKMERGKGNPTLDSIGKIARALGVTVIELLDS